MNKIYRKKIGEVDKKIPGTSGLVTTTLLRMKFLIMLNLLLLKNLKS